jgi:hypothetical protein
MGADLADHITGRGLARIQTQSQQGVVRHWRRPLEHADAPRSRKSGDAMPRREFVPRDPCRSNPDQRCMPRCQA